MKMEIANAYLTTPFVNGIPYPPSAGTTKNMWLGVWQSMRWERVPFGDHEACNVIIDFQLESWDAVKRALTAFEKVI